MTIETFAFLLFLAFMFGGIFCIWFMEDKEKQQSAAGEGSK